MQIYGFCHYEVKEDMDTDMDMRCSKKLHFKSMLASRGGVYPCLEVDDALFYIQNDTGDDEIWKGCAVFRVFRVLGFV